MKSDDESDVYPWITNVEIYAQILIIINWLIEVELARRSGSVMDCHATALGSIPGGNGVFTVLHVLRKGQ